MPAASPEPTEDPPTIGQQRADALALLAESALHQGLDPGTPGERYQVVVHVDAAALADPEAPGPSVLEDGQRVSAGTSARLACDATRVVMRHDAAGRIVEVGARTRTIPPALRRALAAREDPHETSLATSSSVRYPRASAKGRLRRRKPSNRMRFNCRWRASRTRSLRVRPICRQRRSRSFSSYPPVVRASGGSGARHREATPPTRP
jgi:hypothetical protein